MPNFHNKKAKEKFSSITIPVQSNPRSTAQKYIIQYLGMNIHIKNLRKHSENLWRLNIFAIIPFSITLASGHVLKGELKTNSLESMLIEKRKNAFFVKIKPDTKLIDKKLEIKIKDFISKLHVNKMNMDGRIYEFGEKKRV